MREINKEYVETKKRKKYKAIDGTEFLYKSDCIEYERELYLKRAMQLPHKEIQLSFTVDNLLFILVEKEKELSAVKDAYKKSGGEEDIKDVEFPEWLIFDAETWKYCGTLSEEKAKIEALEDTLDRAMRETEG